MTKFALMSAPFPTLVVAIFDSSTGPVPQGYTAVDVTSQPSVTNGWVWNGGTSFSTPPAPSAPPAMVGPRIFSIPSDLTMSSSTLADVTGMAFQLRANSLYRFAFLNWFRTAATTTGILFTITGPTSPAFLDICAEIALTASLFNIQRISTYDAGIPTPSIDVAATDRLSRITGVIITGAVDGILQLRWRSEVNLSTVTLRQGSFGRLVAG